ncbi:Flp family type IVb pilin [Falsiroseomonas sp. CW058]|uniref:Flp family type IVb pilin n=1 Tax=Falsiroseomonas sp. CW058 TaxID=3388664 RepID=UPI003D315E89
MRTTAALILATLRDRKGVTAAEYAVLAVGVVAVVATAASALGTRLSTVFSGIVGS